MFSLIPVFKSHWYHKKCGFIDLYVNGNLLEKFSNFGQNRLMELTTYYLLIYDPKVH